MGNTPARIRQHRRLSKSRPHAGPVGPSTSYYVLQLTYNRRAAQTTRKSVNPPPPRLEAQSESVRRGLAFTIGRIVWENPRSNQRKPANKPPVRLGRQAYEAPGGSLCYCTCAQEAISTKSAGRKWLVSGLEDHRYLSVTPPPAAPNPRGELTLKTPPPPPALCLSF